MKKFKLVVRTIFFLYLSLTVLLGYNADYISSNGFLFWGKGLIKFMDNALIWGFVGIIVIVIAFTVDNLQIYNLKKENNAKEADIIKLKAQMFDLKSSIDPEPDQEEEVKEESPEGEQAG